MKKCVGLPSFFADFRPLFRLGGHGSPGIPFDHRSLRQPDPAQQVGEVGVWAKRVKPRVHFHVS
jgi:hypothetical protein